MSEIYRKIGTSLRYERRGSSLATVRSSEHGEAAISDGVFRAQTLNSSLGGETIEWNLDAFHQRIEDAVHPSLAIERATLVEGVADHWWTDGEQERTWSEKSARAHITVTNLIRRIRASCDLGAATSETIDLAPLSMMSDALCSYSTDAPPPGPSIVLLEAAVTAELLPRLLDSFERGNSLREQPASLVRQGSHPEFALDGTGAPIRAADILDENGSVSLPNVFRPSYRSRPIRAPFHLELTGGEKTAAVADLAAVAVLSPFIVNQRGIEGSLLLQRIDRAGAFAATVSITIEDSFEVFLAGESRQWFPVGAGSYGQRVVLRGVTLRPIRD